MDNNKLPEGWVCSTISSIANIKGGKRLPKGKSFSNSPTNHPYLRVTDFQDGNIITLGLKYIDEDTFNNISTYTINKSDLYISIAGTIGLVGSIPDYLDGASLTENAAKICDIEISKSYLKFFLNSNSAKNQFIEKTVSSGQPKLALFRIRDCELFVAPLAEQKIIAEKLDSLLAQVESTKARLEGIPGILKQFRQSVLAAAVSGELTEDWRGTKELIGWREETIGTVADVSTGTTPKRTENKFWDGGDIPWLTSAATGKLFTYEAEQFVTEQAVKECSLKVFPEGTLLLAMYGEGKTRGQVTEMKISAACNQACAAITIHDKAIDLTFLKFILISNYEETRRAAAGGNQPNLNLKKVRDIPIPLPSIEEQEEIVRRVEELFGVADKVAAQVKTAMESVNHLTQSILAQAFSGELTKDWREQNPDLISGENSAAALLERIKAEREKLKVTGKRV